MLPIHLSMGKWTRGCAYKNKALITLISCEIWRDISPYLTLTRVISLIYIYIYMCVCKFLCIQAVLNQWTVPLEWHLEWHTVEPGMLGYVLNTEVSLAQ